MPDERSLDRKLGDEAFQDLVEWAHAANLQAVDEKIPLGGRPVTWGATLSEEEARELTGESLMHKAARAILTLGPEIAVIKQGEHGAFLQSRDLYFTCPAVPIESVIDPTGAGDTFAGGFFGALARMERVTDRTLRAAVVYGCVMASFTVEDFGVLGLARVQRPEILRRADQVMEMTRFSLDNTARLLR